MNDKQLREIHVALAVYDPEGTYSKYAGVAITSILKSTKSKVVVHLLVDRYMSENNRLFFQEIADKFNQRIVFYEIDLGDKIPDVIGLKRVTRGTLYRLKLPELISQDIDRIIYLDSDVIVNFDIQSLWDEPFDGCSIIAVKDQGGNNAIRGYLKESGILNPDLYYNAGVMVWNLRKIRAEHDIYEEAMSFFELYGIYCEGFTDQHASNAIFKNDVRYVPNKYNLITKNIRNIGHHLGEYIYHFADEIPKMELNEEFDVLFYNTLAETPWGKEEMISFFSRGIRARNAAIDRYRSLLKKVRDKKIVFWGCGSKYFEDVVRLFSTDTSKDFCVDSNDKYFGNEQCGLHVYSKDILEDYDKDKILVIVISKLYYESIKEVLIGFGMKENEDFFDGLLLLDDCTARRYVKA